MFANGNSFNWTGSGFSNGQSMMNPESSTKEGLAIVLGFMGGIQKLGNA